MCVFVIPMWISPSRAEGYNCNRAPTGQVRFSTVFGLECNQIEREKMKCPKRINKEHVEMKKKKERVEYADITSPEVSPHLSMSRTFNDAP